MGDDEDGSMGSPGGMGGFGGGIDPNDLANIFMNFSGRGGGGFGGGGYGGGGFHFHS